MEAPKQSDHPLKRLLKYIKELRASIYRASTYSVLNKLFDIAPEVLIGVAVDLVVKREDSLIARFGFESPLSQLTVIGVLTLVIWGCESLFQFLHQVSWRNLAQAIQHMLRLDAYDHVQRLDMQWFENRSTGNLLAILNDDVNQLERFINEGANEIIQVVVSTILVGAIFFYLSPLVTVFAFAPIPIILFCAFFFQKRLGPRYLDMRNKAGLLAGRLANNVSGIATIKSFTAEEFELEQLSKDSKAYQEANRRAITLSSAFVPTIRMGVLSGFVVTLVLGGWLTLENELGVGSYSVLIFLTQRLLWPLTRLGQTVDNFERSMASTTRIMDLVETEIDVKDPDNPEPLDKVKGEIVFDSVTFGYTDRDPIFNNFSLRQEEGTFLGLVGGTGSGKSTLVKLLLRFFDPEDGRILLDGKDLRSVRTADLRSNIGLVSQEVFLFHGTVRENIAYSTPEISHEEIEQAAKIAEAHEFIAELPDGYDTVVGERGQKLSGGQRQRISIARAVLKDPPILILDEATSAVDNETEEAIQRSLAKVAVGRTMIVVAHRLSTIRNADSIYVISNGEVEASGTHAELLTKSPYYKKLWSIQTGE